jgi:hypothetical protein
MGYDSNTVNATMSNLVNGGGDPSNFYLAYTQSRGGQYAPRGTTPLTPQGGDIGDEKGGGGGGSGGGGGTGGGGTGGSGDDPRLDNDFMKWMRHELARIWGTNTARADQYFQYLNTPEAVGELTRYMSIYREGKPIPEHEAAIIRGGSGSPVGGGREFRDREVEVGGGGGGTWQPTVPPDINIPRRPPGKTWQENVQAWIDEFKRRLGAGEYDPGQFYEFQGQLGLLQNLLDQHNKPTTGPFSDQYLPGQIDPSQYFQTGQLPNAKDYFGTGNLPDASKYFQTEGAPNAKDYFGRLNLPNANEAFAPSFINNYFDTARGNLSGQAGTASSQAANRAAAMAASRGMVNPSGFTAAAASQASAPFANQFGALEEQRALAMQQNAQNLFNALSGQEMAQAGQQANLYNALMGQTQRADTQQQNLYNALMNQNLFGAQQGQNLYNALMGQKQFGAQQGQNLYNALNQQQQQQEAARQFQVGNLFNQNQNRFDQATTLTGLGKLYTTKQTPDWLGTALGGLFNLGSAYLGGKR